MEGKTIIVKTGSFSSFLRGVLVGAAIGLLLAPRTGRETRDMLTQKSSEIRDKATNIAKDTRDRAQNVIGEARSKVEGTFKSTKEQLKDSNRELKREVNIMEDINNPSFPL